MLLDDEEEPVDEGLLVAAEVDVVVVDVVLVAVGDNDSEALEVGTVNGGAPDVSAAVEAPPPQPATATASPTLITSAAKPAGM